MHVKLWLTFGFIFSLTSQAATIGKDYFAGAAQCPVEDALNHYVEVPLFPDLAQTAQVQNIHGLKLHDDLRKSVMNLNLSIYFELLKPYDPKQEMLMLINGGPGGDHEIIHSFYDSMKDTTNVFKDFNVVAMDHRGLGCSRPIFPGDMPVESFLMRYAAYDIDAIRQALGGPDAKIDVMGASYGTMLGQTYALLFPKHLNRLMLASAFSSHQDFLEADRNYESLLLDWHPALKADFAKLNGLSAEIARAFLQWTVSPMYVYAGRTRAIPAKMAEVLALVQKQDYVGAKAALPNPGWVMSPMMRAIVCQEIFESAPEDGKFHMFNSQFQSCKEFDGLYDYFDYTADLKNITARTLLWSGQFDHVTPRPAMEKMVPQIADHFYYRDPHLGHAAREKQACFNRMFESFFNGGSNVSLQVIADSPDCKNPPPL